MIDAPTLSIPPIIVPSIRIPSVTVPSGLARLGGTLGPDGKFYVTDVVLR